MDVNQPLESRRILDLTGHAEKPRLGLQKSLEFSQLKIKPYHRIVVYLSVSCHFKAYALVAFLNHPMLKPSHLFRENCTLLSDF